MQKEGRQARPGREGSSRKQTDTKLVVSKRPSPILPLKERVSKTCPSHKIVAKVNLFVHEALGCYSKYYQNIHKGKILI